jgi:biotin carboxyl carrier protein
MKYYLINSEGSETVIELQANRLKDQSIAFEVTSMKEENLTLESKSTTYFVKTLADNAYISKDKINWRRIPKMKGNQPIVRINSSVRVYQGFKPSGLSKSAPGDLKTDMPGKVIKVFTAVGSVVNSGDTLMILEAMKMENEIKASMDGVIKAVHVKEGQILESGSLMIEIEK